MDDRALRVEPGEVIVTGYVPMHRVRLGCKARMSVGDVDRAYQKTIQSAPSQLWPPSNGHWEVDENDGTRQFVICDGRHEYVSKLMLGYSHILVAWKEKQNVRSNGTDA